jgi:heavy metal translocating P-type ATPase
VYVVTGVASPAPSGKRDSPGLPPLTAISVARLDALYLIIVTGGLVGGIIAAIGGVGGVDTVIWAASAAIGLAFIAASVVTGLLRGQAGVDIIALLAITGALVLGEYLAGAVIGVMLASGRALEDFAAARSRRELTALLARAPKVANRKAAGAIQTIPIGQVTSGDLLMVKPGEVVPVDGLLLTGSASLDEAAITGESRVAERGPGERVNSGSVNVGSPFEFRATATAEHSTYSGIVRLVREAQASRAPSARLADRYALMFVPLTLVVAGAAWLASGDAVRALAVLVVATPCPLILAVPVAIVSGISRSARRGIIVKGGAAMEALAKARVLLFDKTGTLTEGRPVVSEVVEADGASAEILRLAASLEQVSPHVHAAAIVREARSQGAALTLPADVAEETGLGIHGKVDGHRVAIGRLEWVSPGTTPPAWVRRLRRHIVFDSQAVVYVSIDGALAGAIVLEDPMRSDAPRTLRLLRRTSTGS